MTSGPAEAWIQALAEGGYDHFCRTPDEFRRVRRLGQAWRRIMRTTRLSSPATAFEIGCGGGVHLATLAANGFHVSGIDVSPAVADRARRYLSEVAAFGNGEISVDITTGDFFETNGISQADLVYHFGVVEHYLDPGQRQEFWRRAVEIAKPGGYVVSVVPCGRHLMRKAMREKELLGYRHALAEFDYSCEIHRTEFQAAGLRDVVLLPHAYLFFLSAFPSPPVRKMVFPAAYALANTVLPLIPFPEATAERLAHTLIAVGRKPAAPVL